MDNFVGAYLHSQPHSLWHLLLLPNPLSVGNQVYINTLAINNIGRGRGAKEDSTTNYQLIMFWSV